MLSGMLTEKDLPCHAEGFVSLNPHSRNPFQPRDVAMASVKQMEGDQPSRMKDGGYRLVCRKNGLFAFFLPPYVSCASGTRHALLLQAVHPSRRLFWRIEGSYQLFSPPAAALAVHKKAVFGVPGWCVRQLEADLEAGRDIDEQQCMPSSGCTYLQHGGGCWCL